MATLDFIIENMHCTSCIRQVMQTINALPGTHAEEVRVGAARVTTDIEPVQIEQALDVVGYPAHLLR